MVFIYIFITVLPHINPFAFDGEANSGESVQLTCHVSKGDLPLKLKWFFKGKPIFSNYGIVTSKIGDRSSFLTVSSVAAENSGVYTCLASNAAGTYNYSTELLVNGIIFLNIFLFLFLSLSNSPTTNYAI